MRGHLTHRYLVALGSNMRHPRHGSPRRVLGAALAAMQGGGVALIAASQVIETAPLGPSLRRFANAAAVVESAFAPPELLAILKQVEAEFGRRNRGQAWRARVLDLDIVLWNGGVWTADGLHLPHPRFRERHFVLRPAAAISGDWRDPVTGLSLRQLHRRLTRMGSLPR